MHVSKVNLVDPETGYLVFAYLEIDNQQELATKLALKVKKSVSARKAEQLFPNLSKKMSLMLAESKTKLLDLKTHLLPTLSKELIPEKIS